MTAKRVDDNVDARTYFFEAAELRTTLQQNLDDYEFASAGGEIVYLMDANVVRIFMNPPRDAHLLRPFASDTHRDYLVATAVTTAEFLFSRQLPGQQGAAHLAPAHAAELMQIFQALRHESQEAPSGGIDEEHRREFEYAVAEAAREGTDNGRALALLRSRLTGLLARTFRMFEEMAQFARLQDEDLLRPLALNIGVTSEILSPPASEVAAWEKALRAHIQRSGGTGDMKARSDRHHHRTNSTITADATVLAQLDLLNRSAQEDDSKVQWVLVTADRILYRTYALRYWGSDHKPGDRFALRLPTQYVPVLNVLDMPTHVGKSDLIERTKNALDSLFRNLKSVSDGYPSELPYWVAKMHEEESHRESPLKDLLKKMYGVNPYELDITGNAFERLKDDWREAYENAVLLNSELMNRRARAEFDSLRLLLENKQDLQDAIVSRQQQLMERVEATHVAMYAHANLMSSLDAIRRRSSQPRRAPLAVRVRLARITGDRPLIDFLESIASGLSEEQLADLDRQLGQSLNEEALFFAAAVAFRCGIWQAARHYANRAIELIEQKEVTDPQSVEVKHELFYLYASTIRFTSRSWSSLRKAVELLGQAAEYHAGRSDKLGVARALSERIVAGLTWSFWRALRLAVSPHDAEAVQHGNFRDIPTWIEQALDALVEAEKDPRCQADGEWRTPWLIVRRQIYANVVSYESFRRYIARDFDVELSPGLIASGMAETSRALEEGLLPRVMEIELLALEQHIEPRNGIASKLRELLDWRSAKSLGPEIDQQELAFFSKVLTPAVTEGTH